MPKTKLNTETPFGITTSKSVCQWVLDDSSQLIEDSRPVLRLRHDSVVYTVGVVLLRQRTQVRVWLTIAPDLGLPKIRKSSAFVDGARRYESNTIARAIKHAMILAHVTLPSIPCAENIELLVGNVLLGGNS